MSPDSKFKCKGKAQWINLSEFIYGHYGTVEVSEEFLGLYKKYILIVPKFLFDIYV